MWYCVSVTDRGPDLYVPLSLFISCFRTNYICLCFFQALHASKQARITYTQISDSLNYNINYYKYISKHESAITRVTRWNYICITTAWILIVLLLLFIRLHKFRLVFIDRVTNIFFFQKKFSGREWRRIISIYLNTICIYCCTRYHDYYLYKY